MTPDAAPQNRVVAHSIGLLEEPRFGAHILALIPAGAPTRFLGASQGFAQVYVDGNTGYIPQALLQPEGAPPQAAPVVYVARATALLRTPLAGDPLSWAADRWMLLPDEPLIVEQTVGNDLIVRRTDGQRGAIPARICGPPQKHNNQQVAHIVAPMTLVRGNTPMAQLIWVQPDQPLRVLGTTGAFALVQLDNGQIGFIDAQTYDPASRDAIMPFKRFDLGWVAIGGMWAMLNGLSAVGIVAGIGAGMSGFAPFVLLTLVLVIVVMLWLSPRHRSGRSMGIGVILCYAFFHLVTGGGATLWR